MQYSILTSCLLALASTSTVFAQTAGFAPITEPTLNEVVPAGSSFTITWEPTGAAGKVSLTLLEGATQGTLQLGATIASAIDSTAGSYTWTVPSTSSYATYGIKLSLDSDPATFQYSFPFSIAASAASSSTVKPVQSTVTQLISLVSTPAASAPATSAPAVSAPVTSIPAVPSVPAVAATLQTSYVYPNSTALVAASGTAPSTTSATGAVSNTTSSTIAKQTVNAAPGMAATGGMLSLAAIVMALLI